MKRVRGVATKYGLIKGFLVMSVGARCIRYGVSVELKTGKCLFVYNVNIDRLISAIVYPVMGG